MNKQKQMILNEATMKGETGVQMVSIGANIQNTSVMSESPVHTCPKYFGCTFIVIS